MALPNEAAQRRPSPSSMQLAAAVERQLRPRPAAVRPRRRAAVIGLVATVALLWGLGLAGSLAGAMMASEGFRVDALQQELTTAQRQQQRLAGLLASATTITRLNQDATRLGVPLSPLVVADPAPARLAPAPRRGALASLMARIGLFWSRVKRLEAGLAR